MQGARLDRFLNITLPVDDTSLGTVWVFSTPISYPTFERYHREMARAWSMVAGMGGMASGPRIAAMELKRTAQDMGTWDDPPDAPGTGVERGLVAEIRRLTNVVCPMEGGGWEPVPLMDAYAQGILDDDDLRDVEGVVAFFILASAMQRHKQLVMTLSAMAVFVGAQTTSLGCSEWIASELSSNGTGTSGPSPMPGNRSAEPSGTAAAPAVVEPTSSGTRAGPAPSPAPGGNRSLPVY